MSPRNKASRSGERGATIFIVTLIVALLSAMGIFAVRAASLTQAAAGYDRLNEQTHYVMEHGVLLTAAEVGRNPAAYLQVASTAGGCFSLAGLPTGTSGTSHPCAKFTFDQLGASVTGAQASGGTISSPILAPATGPNNGLDPGANLPGSLGPAALNPRIYVEMTDVGPVGRPPAGSSVGGAGTKFGYLQATLSGWGQVGPSVGANPNVCGTAEQNASLVTSRETGRAHIILGPVPR